MTDTLSGGIKKLKGDFYRVTIRAAALEGKIFVFQESGSSKILSVSLAFGPDVEFMGR